MPAVPIGSWAVALELVIRPRMLELFLAAGLALVSAGRMIRLRTLFMLSESW